MLLADSSSWSPLIFLDSADCKVQSFRLLCLFKIRRPTTLATSTGGLTSSIVADYFLTQFRLLSIAYFWFVVSVSGTLLLCFCIGVFVLFLDVLRWCFEVALSSTIAFDFFTGCLALEVSTLGLLLVYFYWLKTPSFQLQLSINGRFDSMLL